jgi:E3 ubiquitin-protein ligase HECTD2
MAHRINRAMKSKRDLPKAYESDWKVASAARVMALLCKLVQQRAGSVKLNTYC